MKKVTNKNQEVIFNNACKNYLLAKNTKKDIEKTEKELKTKIYDFISSGFSDTDKYKANLSERKRKKVKDEAPSLLKEFIGDEAKDYIVTVEVLPEEIIEKLVNSGKITAEQAEKLYKISSYSVLNVKQK